MKTSLKALILLAALGSATLLIAQEFRPPQHGPGGPEGPGGPGHRPPPPVIGALDENHDGVIDANEIANASRALLRLDRNGDGKLTPDELHPPRPDGVGPEGPGMDRPGPRGPGRPGPDGPPPQE